MDSYWHSLSDGDRSDDLHDTVDADVVIIGGGVTGMAAALPLARSGASVVIVEREYCGSGASGRSAGFIMADTEREFASLVRTCGLENARRLWHFAESGVESIRTYGQTSRALQMIAADATFVALSETALDRVSAEASAREQAGFRSGRLYGRETVSEIIDGAGFVGAIRYPGTFSIDPFGLCREMKDACLRSGVRIFEHTEATAWSDNLLQTPRGSVRYRRAIVCTDIPTRDTYHVLTFAAVTRQQAPEVMNRLFPSGPLLVWDTETIYHYFRPTTDGRLLIGGGDIKTTYARNIPQLQSRFARTFSEYISEHLPAADPRIQHIWPGMIGVSEDLLPIMGPDAKDDSIWYAGAATGLSWAHALGTYAAEHILSGRSDMDELLSWNRRFPLGTVRRLFPKPIRHAVSHALIGYL